MELLAVLIVHYGLQIFWLPTVNTLCRLLSFGFRAVDIDIEEMFLNFSLRKSLRLYSGVDLSAIRHQIF